MISYDTYQNKIKRVASVKNFIVRFRALFIALLALLIAFIVTVIFTKGIITQDVVLPEKIVYGDDYSKNVVLPKALFGGADFEFARVKQSSGIQPVRHSLTSDGEEDGYEWFSEYPTLAGKYLVRTVSKTTFGLKYGDPKSFEIEPYAAEFVIESDSVVYGELPENYTFNLLSGDTLVTEGATLDYGDVTLDKTTAFGKLSSFRIINAAGNDVTDCYIISVPEKEVEITPRAITLTTENMSFVYDGKPVTGIDVLDGESIKSLKGDSARIETKVYDSYGNAVEGNPSDVGEYIVTIVAESTTLTRGGADVIKHYNVTYGSAKLSITARRAEVTTASGTKEYDGESFTLDETECANLSEGHKISAEVKDAQKIDAGEYVNEYIFTVYDALGADVTKNYVFDCNFGTLKIAPRTVTVTTQNRTKVYDGYDLSEQNFNGFAVEKEGADALVSGHTALLDTCNKISDCKDSGAENSITVKISDGDGADVTKNYRINYVYGTLNIERRAITVTSPDESWVFDGDYHDTSAENLILERENGEAPLSDLDEIIVTADSARVLSVKEGRIENKVKCLVMGPKEVFSGVGIRVPVDKTQNYDITYVTGTLEITPRPLTLTTPSLDKEYDGSSLTSLNAPIPVISDNLVVGDSVKVDEWSTILAVGEKENRAVCSIFSTYTVTGGIDVTSETAHNYDYEITYVYGTLAITKRMLEIVTPDQWREYNGLALSILDDEPAVLGLVSGENLRLIDCASLTDAGTLANEAHYTVFAADAENGSGRETTENYEISYFYGTLTVYRREVGVLTPTGSREYDGTAYSLTEGVTVIEPFTLVEGHSLVLDEAFAPASVTGVGEGYVNNVFFLKVTDGERDVSENYSLVYNYGTINITPRPVTVTTADATWTYANTYYSAPQAEIKYGGDEQKQALIAGHSLVLDEEYKVIEAGVYGNYCTFDIVGEDGLSYLENYNLAVNAGTLTVLKRPVVITTFDGHGEYDDNPFYNIRAEAEEYDGENFRGILEGHVIVHDELATTASVTYVTEGEVENELHYLIFEGERNVGENYEIEYVYGKIHVTPRNLSLLTATSSGEFDGQPYYDIRYTVESGSFAGNHGTKALSYAQVTFVTEGEVENQVVYSIVNGSENLTENYALEVKYGKISRTPRNILVMTADHTFVYDGETHFDTAYKDFHLGYGIIQDGEIISGTPDGAEGLVSGHTLSPLAWTTVRDYTPEPVANEISYIVVDENINKNYRLLMKYGSLSVDKRPIIVYTATDEKVYDGDPLFRTDGWRVEGGTWQDNTLGDGLVGSHTLGVRLDGEGNPVLVTRITDVYYADGKVAGIDNVVEYDVFDGSDNVSVNYTVEEYRYGTLTVTPRPITVTTATAVRQYNGLALTDGNFTYDIATEGANGGLLASKNHIVEPLDGNLPSITYILPDGNGGEIDSAENAFSFKITVDGGDISLNYAITEVYGTLTLTKRPLNITTATLAWEYNGEVHYGDETQPAAGGSAEFSDLVIIDGVYEGFAADVRAEITDYTFGGVANSTRYRLYSVDGTTDTTLCYRAEYTDGRLYINKINLNITTLSPERIYNGEPLNGDDESYGTPEFEGLISGERWTSHSVAFRTDYGVTPNTTQYYTYAVRGGQRTDTTENYIISYTLGEISVKKRPLTIRTATDSREYDGTEFTQPLGWRDEGEYRLLSGHTLNAVEITGKITDVKYVDGAIMGVENVVAYEVVDASGSNAVDVNYEISYIYGHISVTPRNILVTTASHGWVYDGKAHSDDGYVRVVHIKDGADDGQFALVEGHTLACVGDKTYVTDYTPQPVVNKVEYGVFLGTESVSGNYKIKLTEGEEAGKLEITKRPLAITTASASREYNGTALTKTDEFTVEPFNEARNTGILPVHTALVDTGREIASVTYVHEGEVDNKMYFAVLADDGEDVTQNYNLDSYYVYGKLVITPHAISLITATLEKVYDGKTLFGTERQPEIEGGLFASDRLVSDRVAQITNVNSVANNTTYKIYNLTDEDISDSYRITYTVGQLTVTPRPIVITTATLEKIYDGTPLYGYEPENSAEITVITPTSADNLAENESYDPSYVAATTLAAEEAVENGTLFKIYGVRGGQRVETTSNYELDYITGTLTVNKRAIIIATASASRNYDGTLLFNSDAEVTSEVKLAAGHALRPFGEIPSLTNVGTKENAVEYRVYYGGKDVTENYTLSYYNYFVGKKYGVLEITPRRISLKSADGEWVYDGMTHFDSNYVDLTYLGDDGKPALVSGHAIFAVTNPLPSIIDVGTVENDVKYIVSDTETTKNYSFENVRHGTLTVTKRTLNIALDVIDDGVYGEPFAGYPKDNPFRYTDSVRPANGETLKITVEYTFGGGVVEKTVNAGEYGVRCALLKIEGGRANLLNYSVICTGSYFTIQKRELEISLKSPENGGKVYDGKAYSFPAAEGEGYEIIKGSMAEGEALSVAVTYSIDGKSFENPFDAGNYKIAFNSLMSTVNGASAANYEITCNNETYYEITQKPLVFVLKDVTLEYNGSGNYSVKNSNALEFDESQLAEGDIITNVSAYTKRGGEICNAVEVGVYDYFVDKFTVVAFADGRDVSGNYRLGDFENSSDIEIIRRKISLSVSFNGSESDSHEYTGEEINLNTLYSPYGPYASLHDSSFENNDGESWGIYANDIKNLSAVFSFTKNGEQVKLKELGVYEVSVTLEDAEGCDTLKNYEIVSSATGYFEVTRRQVNVYPCIPSVWLEYDGEKLNTSVLDYYTLHRTSDEVGFISESDKDDYTAEYSLFEDGSEVNLIDNILQAGTYCLRVRLTYKGAGQEKYYINNNNGFKSGPFEVHKRKIYAVVPDDKGEYLYNGKALAEPETYITYYADGKNVENSGFVRDDANYAQPIYGYENFTFATTFDEAKNAGAYNVKVSSFVGVNPAGDVDISENYAVEELPEGGTLKYGTLTIRPAKLVILPKNYTKLYDGTEQVISLPADSYTVYYVEGNDGELYDGEKIEFTADKTLDILKSNVTMVSFTSVRIVKDGFDVTGNYDVIINSAQQKAKLPEFSDALLGKFSALLSFKQRKVVIKQFAPPEKYREAEYGTYETIILDDKNVPAECITNRGDGLLAGHRVVVSNAMVMAFELGYSKSWILMCKVYDASGRDLSMGYTVEVDNADESVYRDTYIKVVPKKVQIGVNYAPSEFEEGATVEDSAYNIPSKAFVFGDKLTVTVTGGQFVAKVTAVNGSDKGEYYIISFAYPGMEDKEEEGHEPRV